MTVWLQVYNYFLPFSYFNQEVSIPIIKTIKLIYVPINVTHNDDLSAANFFCVPVDALHKLSIDSVA